MSDIHPKAAPVRHLQLMAVPGLPDFAAGDDLALAVVNAAEAGGMAFAAGDVVVVAQKVVSKCEGAHVNLLDVVAGRRAMELALETGKDPRLVEVVLGETSEVLRARQGVLIVATKAGHVMANAGVDHSNVVGGDAGVVLKLPIDADRSARGLRQRLRALTGNDLAVVINDSWGRAWRNGTVGHAVGAAGFAALWDRRGEHDMHGRPLKVTEIGLADEIAAAASLVMGAASERQPVVIVRGLVLPAGEGAAVDLVRDRARDLFR